MVAEQLNNSSRKRIKLAFVVLMVILPIQFAWVYNYGNIYPCVHMPAFKPVLDDHEGHLFYSDVDLYFVTKDKSRIPVVYTELFDGLPEFFARHTMYRLFKYNEPNATLTVDGITEAWLVERAGTITNRDDITGLLLVTTDYRYNKEEPTEPKRTITSTNYLALP